MVSDINGEGSSPGREDGDPTEMTAAREADSSAAGAAEAQALLPPPQTLPPAQGLDSQQFAQLGSAGSPPAWPSAATPDGGSGPGYPSQPSSVRQLDEAAQGVGEAHLAGSAGADADQPGWRRRRPGSGLATWPR
jgi:hypothetical protein